MLDIQYHASERGRIDVASVYKLHQDMAECVGREGSLILEVLDYLRN